MSQLPANKKRWKRTEWTRIFSVNSKLPLRTCLICGQQLKRKCYGKVFHYVNNKKYVSDHWEIMTRFLKRKTCGKTQNADGKWIFTDCLRKWLVLYNPNDKGIHPKCVDCGRVPKGYSSKTGYISKRCFKCFQIYARKTNWYEKQAEVKIVARMRLRKGIYPENLKPYAFQKGMKPKNKLYEEDSQCKENDCIRKPIAKGMCYMHWQRNRKLELNFYH